MALFLGRTDVDRLFAEGIVTPRDCVDAVEASFREHGDRQVGVVPRQILTADGEEPEPRSRALKLSASYMRASGTMGASVYTTHFRPGDVDMWLLVFCGSTGELDGILHGKSLSLWKTGATGAVAARTLARRRARRAAIIGTGYYATAQLACLAAVIDLAEVRCHSRDAGRRAAFADRARASLPGVDVRSCASAREAVDGAEVVVTITTSPTPVVEGAWLAPGVHVNAMGQHAPRARELDTVAVREGRVFVDAREQAMQEKGELLVPLAAGEIDAGVIAGELGEAITGRVPGRTHEAERTVFLSGGTALEYMGLCRMLVARARAGGVGRELD